MKGDDGSAAVRVELNADEMGGGASSPNGSITKRFVTGLTLTAAAAVAILFFTRIDGDPAERDRAQALVIDTSRPASSQVSAEPASLDPAGTIFSIAATELGYMAAGSSDGQPMLWSSADGNIWTEIEPDLPPFAGAGRRWLDHLIFIDTGFAVLDLDDPIEALFPDELIGFDPLPDRARRLVSADGILWSVDERFPEFGLSYSNDIFHHDADGIGVTTDGLQTLDEVGGAIDQWTTPRESASTENFCGWSKTPSSTADAAGSDEPPAVTRPAYFDGSSVRLELQQSVSPSSGCHRFIELDEADALIVTDLVRGPTSLVIPKDVGIFDLSTLEAAFDRRGGIFVNTILGLYRVEVETDSWALAAKDIRDSQAGPVSQLFVSDDGVLTAMTNRTLRWGTESESLSGAAIQPPLSPMAELLFVHDDNVFISDGGALLIIQRP